VRHLDQRGATVLQRLGRRVMAKIGGEVDVDTSGARVVEPFVAGATRDRDPADQQIRITGHPDPGRGRRQPAPDPSHERGQGLRLGQLADPADPQGGTAR